MTDRPVVVMGFVPVALTSLAEFQPAGSVVVIEEPDVAQKRGARAKVADSPVARELIEWEYQLPGAADEFVNAHPDLRPAAVAPLQEYATPFAARLAERYGLPGAGLGAALLLRDKSLLRKVTGVAGIANPESAPVDSPRQVRDFMAANPGPAVLKPANRQAAVGTMIVRAAGDVDRAWAECVEQDEGVYVPDRPMPLQMLAERYLSGPEYSVEMLVDRGAPVFANVTDKVLYPGPRPIEAGHLVPADIPPELWAALIDQTAAVLRAVGFGTGIVHCEWIVVAGRPYLVECAGRFAGDGVIELVDRAYRVDMVPAFYALMKGEPLPRPLPRRAELGAAVRFLHVEAGEVLSIDGLDEARAVPGVTSCDVSVQPGDHVRELHSSWDRVGSAIACAPTAAEAMRRAQDALDRVQVKVAPPH
jgi:biotin carboxylase